MKKNAKKLLSPLVLFSYLHAIFTPVYAEDFLNSPGKELVSGLKGAVINSVGATVAGEIGFARHNESIDSVGHKFLHAGLGGALGFVSMGNVNGAISGAIGAFVAELAADALYEDPNISNVRAAEKAIERGIAPTKENLAAIIREDMQATMSFAKFTGAFAAFAAGKDPNVAYHTADNAIENNFANFVIMGALTAFEAYEDELEQNRDAIIDYVAAKTGLSRDVVAASFDGMMMAGRVGNQVADLIPGRSKAKKIAANGVKKVVSAVKGKLSGDGAPTVKPNENPKNVALPEKQKVELGQQEKAGMSNAQIQEPGVIIAGPGAAKKFIDEPRIINQYGGKTGEWIKKLSTNFNGKDGTSFSTHWVENLKTGERIEFKTIINK